MNSLAEDARIRDLERRLDALEKRHEQDMANLREDLSNLVSYMDIALEKMADEGGASGGSAEQHAKRAFEKSLEDLKSFGQEVLERLKRELDEITPGQTP